MRPSIALLAAALLVTAAPSAPARQELASQAETPAVESARILEEYEAAYKEYRAALAGAEDAEVQQGLRAEQDARFEACCARLMALAEEAPADPALGQALVWVVQRSGSGPRCLRACALLLEHHADGRGLDTALSAYEREMGAGRALLEELAASDPREEVRARARFSLAQHLLQRAEYARQLAPFDPDERALYMPDFGPEVATALAGESPSALTLEAEALFAALQAEAPEVPHPYRGTLGKACALELFELRHLQPGMTAPDIEGEDLDGVAFRLSDYRGKVVVLDFWGNW